MARRGRLPSAKASAEASAAPGLNLMDLPGAILESILLLLSHDEDALVSSSPVLFRKFTAVSYSRKQTLAMFRWLSGGCRGAQAARLYCTSQKVSIERPLGLALSMQGACLKKLFFWMADAPIQLTGSWLSSLSRLQRLNVTSRSVLLGSACGQLTALRELTVRCGRERPSPDVGKWDAVYWSPNTVIVQPGAIPQGLTSVSFAFCTLPQLPEALCAASGLEELKLNLCAASREAEGCQAPLLAPILTRLTALEALQLKRLVLEQQDVAQQLWRLTKLRKLDLTDCCVQPGEQQALCSGLTCLSCLTALALAGGVWRGNLQAKPASLPSVQMFNALLPPGAGDQPLPVVSAMPGLQAILVSASSLLGGSGLLQQLQQLPELVELIIILPPGGNMRDQVVDGGARRLVDGIASLPALQHVLLLFADEEMLQDACFTSTGDGLTQAGVDSDCVLFKEAVGELFY
ncbi:E3 ubiquitin- ligase slrP [Chlorella sorokiniana]|uniref:E3 ubiquitin-ligase slrP n=1 Tax=Chlorella sorokiniana TaxID=3076 RepID=A0A2P6TZU7_CHLSO|nr:E3 ubiquitin- ligase slrP [Chlorella sorokiniana]|eukprot:PRW59589.1 E3 ubiquitin- ligase slrP [Chlorella sorokiniana]